MNIRLKWREGVVLKVVVLVEDKEEKNEFGSEHGVSFYIETNMHKILFD